jgi:hypothetical protein
MSDKGTEQAGEGKGESSGKESGERMQTVGVPMPVEVKQALAKEAKLQSRSTASILRELAIAWLGRGGNPPSPKL